KELELLCWIDPQVPEVIVGDVTRLRQILINLLSNAVKFTSQGEVSVSVTVEQIEGEGIEGEGIEGEGINHEPSPVKAFQVNAASEGRQFRLRFAVQDTGLGIPRDRLERLFQPFSQVDSSTTRKYGGTGLGLVISKRLCEMMHGSIWVESQTGQGSTFFFTLLTYATTDTPAPNLLTPLIDLAGKRLLIVDDNVTNCRILTLQTQAWGMLPEAVQSGAAALELLTDSTNFDLLIIDMLMPEMDGASLATAVRQHPKGRNLPIVMLTSLGKQDSDALDPVKASAYLLKPIKQSQLMNTLISLLNSCPIRVQPRSSFRQPSEFLVPEPLPLKILLAEDNAVNQKLALLMLQRLGYRADVAANGLEVLEALHRQPYNLILMDVQMPEMDGLEATQKICQQWDTASRPWIVAMTANAMQGDREICLDAGMNDYISKPVRMEELLQIFYRYQACQAQSSVETVQAVASDSPPSALAPAPALNPQTFANLREIAGDNEADLREIITCFLETAPPMIDILQQAVAKEDAKLLSSTAHKLKSASATFGAIALAQYCADLETGKYHPSVLDAGEKVEQLRAEYDRVQVALNQILGNQSGLL
ncbi:MAG: response regulator, partial [Leptolyngbyaceae bacterium]|nr:response regulator [Leptolyngbyaceae bacterium]